MVIQDVEFSNRGGTKIQSQFSMSKIIRIFLIFFSLKNSNLGAHVLLLTIFDDNNFSTTLLLELGQIFDEVAKLGK